MAVTKAAMLNNISGKPYIRLASTPLATTTIDGQITAKKTDVQTEFQNNWYPLDISAEKWNIGKSASTTTIFASDDANYETEKEFTGDGMMISVDKSVADYINDTYHNQRVDIGFFRDGAGRSAVVYDVVLQCNIQLQTQEKAMLAITYKEKGGADVIKDTWTILELVTADNLPVVETLQAEDDGVGTAGIVGKIASKGTTAISAVGTISAAGFVMSKTNNPPTTADTTVDGTRTEVGYMFKDAVTATAGTWYVRAYATNAAGTSYGRVITMITT